MKFSREGNMSILSEVDTYNIYATATLENVHALTILNSIKIWIFWIQNLFHSVNRKQNISEHEFWDPAG